MIEIRTENISPHPKNPRKDLGDLTELTDSIRAFGVLQNLTVVPDEDDNYICLCGHRRLAAAKAAGLETVPCVIAEGMDEKTQVSIMLLENMQRSDLTVQEEAQGLQMMIDLGSSISEIVRETGLSETKVRHRVKMNELDQDLLGEKLAAQVSINDIIKLEQIKDIEQRNELLQIMGTNNFDWKLREAITNQKKQSTITLIKELYPEAEFADGYYWNYQTFGSVEYEADRADVADFIIDLKAKAEELGKPALIAERSGAFVIAFEKDDAEVSEENREYQRKREERERKNDALKEMRDRVIESWEGFMQEVCKHGDSWFSNKEKIILDTLIEGTFDDMRFYVSLDPDEVSDLLRLDDNEPIQAYINRRWATLAAIAYVVISPGKYDSTWGYSNQEYNEDEAAIFIDTAEYIGLLGYEISDDELAFINGTSELYGREDE